MPYQNVRRGASIGAGAALSGSPTASELQKDPTEKKGSLALLLYCFAAFRTLLAAAVRRASIATFSIWQSTAEYIPTRPWSLTASGFRSKACRFS